jgi:hypothetical protein
MSENIERALGNVEGQLKAVVTSLNDLAGRIDRRDETVDKKFADTHARISKVEKKVYVQTGIAVAAIWMLWHIPAILPAIITTAQAAIR